MVAASTIFLKHTGKRRHFKHLKFQGAPDMKPSVLEDFKNEKIAAAPPWGGVELNGREKINWHLRVQKEPAMDMAIICILTCQMNTGQEKSLQDLPGSTSARGWWQCGSHAATWIHVVQVWWWQSWCAELQVWFDEIFYRKIEETKNTYQLLSRISLKVVSHSASNDVLSKPTSKCTKRWVFHHFPRDSRPWPNWSSCQEGFFYIFSLIFPILNFIPLLLVKPTPIVLNNSPPSGIYPLHVFVGYSFVPL